MYVKKEHPSLANSVKETLSCENESNIDTSKNQSMNDLLEFLKLLDENKIENNVN